MIHCGRLTTKQIIKILGIFQIIGAIIITAVGVAVVIKFIKVHHEAGTDTEFADAYIDMPWTTTYGAAIWMGLIMTIAGALGCFADVKPQKSKYTYATIFINVIVVIAAIMLLIFSHEAVTWFDTCKYTYHKTTTPVKLVNDCSSSDKSKGRQMYWTIFVVTLLQLPLTIAMLVLLVFANYILFDDICDGNCFRKMVYHAKGNGNTTVSFKTKNTHEFKKEMDVPKQEPQEYSKPAVYC